MSPGLAFILIVAVELIVLFRLALPRIVGAFMHMGQARHDAFYGQPNGDCPHLPTIVQPRGD